MQNKMRTTGI